MKFGIPELGFRLRIRRRFLILLPKPMDRQPKGLENGIGVGDFEAVGGGNGGHHWSEQPIRKGLHFLVDRPPEKTNGQSSVNLRCFHGITRSSGAYSG